MSNGESPLPHYRALRDLEMDNADLRLRLARHEFRQMMRELKSETPFKLDVYTGTDAVTVGIVVPMVDDLSLPPLPVPMGSIQVQASAPNLPVIGVYDDGLTGSNLAAALMGLMNTQYHSPFARLIFLCSSFEAVPFLGRYGFAFEHVGTIEPTTVLDRLNRRYGAGQIRSIATGAVLAELGER